MRDVLAAVLETERLKTIQRDQDVKGRPESTAEHSWHMTVLADTLLDFVDEPLNRERVLLLTLYHDLVDVYADDTSWRDTEGKKTQKEREDAAADTLKTILPQGEKFQKLFDEYEARKTREAQFVKACDILESLINRLNEPHTEKEEAYGEEVLEKWSRKHMEKFDVTNTMFDLILEELRKQKKI